MEPQLPQTACLFSCPPLMLGTHGDCWHQALIPPPSSVSSRQNQLILGVMGVDIAINEIKRKTPTYRVTDACHWLRFFYLSISGIIFLHPLSPPPAGS